MYDKNIRNENFNIGDLVYLQNEQKGLNKSEKLCPNYIGPFEIIEINSPVNCTIKQNRKRVKVHTNRLKRAFLPASSPASRQK